MTDSISSDLPGGPPSGDSGDQPGAPGGPGVPGDTNWPAEDAPVSNRLGRNPANVGDEVADEGDVTFPDAAPAPQPAEI